MLNKLNFVFFPKELYFYNQISFSKSPDFYHLALIKILNSANL